MHPYAHFHGVATAISLLWAHIPRQLTAVKANKTPLVGVGAHRVGVLVDLGKTEGLALLRKSPCHAGPSRIDMQECGRVLLYDLANLGNVVDGA